MCFKSVYCNQLVCLLKKDFEFEFEFTCFLCGICFKPDLHETNFSREANFSPRIFCLRIRSLISTGTISFANSPRIMQKNMASVRRLLLFKIASKKAKKGVLGSKNLFRTSAEGGVSSFGKGLTLT